MPEISHPDGQPRNPDVHHERRDVNARSIAFWGVTLAGVVLVVLFLMARLFDHFQAREAAAKKSSLPLAVEERGALSEEDRLPKQPRLEGLPVQRPGHDIGRQRSAGTAYAKNSEEEQRLRETAWVDEKAGIVRIPIDEAMKLAVRERDKFFPTRKQAGAGGKQEKDKP